MKKNIVLIVLFILPIVAYLFFASGVNSFIKLPTITSKINDIDKSWTTLNNEPVTLNKKITILGFSGNDILINKGNFFNLNQKIYNRYNEFKDFQVVFIAPIGTEDDAKLVLKQLSGLTDVSKYHFVFTNPQNIQKFYNGLQLLGKLDAHYGTNNVFIIDKERNLRGRKGKSQKGDEEYKEGFNTSSAAELHNDMVDDVKIILAEYRLALKKNYADRKKYGL